VLFSYCYYSTMLAAGVGGDGGRNGSGDGGVVPLLFIGLDGWTIFYEV
jgi:hypothetical protein